MRERTFEYAVSDQKQCYPIYLLREETAPTRQSAQSKVSERATSTISLECSYSNIICRNVNALPKIPHFKRRRRTRHQDR